MPFGLITSQHIFQSKTDQILGKCHGTISIADDVVVYGKNEEHDKNLRNLMQIAREAGLVFNSKKYSIKTKSVNFFGAIYDDKGVHPNPNKVEDISALSAPQATTELQHLGIITYMSPFIPQLSKHTAPPRDCLKKD